MIQLVRNIEQYDKAFACYVELYRYMKALAIQ